MATHSSNLAWEITWTEKPGGVQSMGSQRVRHDWATNTFTLSFFCELFCLFVSSLFVIVHWNIFMFSLKSLSGISICVSCWHWYLLMVFFHFFWSLSGSWYDEWWLIETSIFWLLYYKTLDLFKAYGSAGLLWLCSEGKEWPLLYFQFGCKSRSSAQTLLTTGWSSPCCWVGVGVQALR